MMHNLPTNDVSAISIVIPAYNEENAIRSVLDNIQTILQNQDFQYEIIVVNDGSIDNTTEVVKQCPGVRVLSHQVNRGYGAALKTGVRHSSYPLICITDADGTYPNEQIPALLSLMHEDAYDMVVGARVGSKVAIPLVRRPAKWVIGKLANFVAGEPIADINSGLRIFHKDIAKSFWEILPEGFSFTTTITLAMLTNGYRVAYHPVDYAKRIGKSKIRPIRDTFNFVQLVLRIALFFAPLKIFLPLSSILFFAALVVALLSRFVLGQLADVTSVVVFVGSIQIAALGLIAELLNRRLPNQYHITSEVTVQSSRQSTAKENKSVISDTGAGGLNRLIPSEEVAAKHRQGELEKG